MGALKNKHIIGLTGGIGSGKTTVANYFIELGIDIVDADEVAREVVEPGTPALKAIENYFGKDYLLTNGELNRAKLRETVFADNEKKLWLNQLLHPAIRESMLFQLAQTKSKYCLLVAPLLLENGLDQFVEKVIVVDVDENTQISRTLDRDGSSPETVKGIIASQIKRKDRLEKADYIINNQLTNLEETKQQVVELHNSLLAQI